MALFVLLNALVQLAQLLVQPGIALAGVLVEQRRRQRMGFDTWCQGLLLACQLFLLLEEFLLLGDQAADPAAQLGEFLLEFIHRLARVGFFAFVVAPQALQQRLGLMVGMLVAAADRAGLIVLQLFA